MAVAMQQTLVDLVNMELKIGELRKALLDNLVTDGKALDTALFNLYNPLHLAIQASAQTPGSDFFELA